MLPTSVIFEFVLSEDVLQNELRRPLRVEGGLLVLPQAQSLPDIDAPRPRRQLAAPLAAQLTLCAAGDID